MTSGRKSRANRAAAPPPVRSGSRKGQRQGSRFWLVAGGVAVLVVAGIAVGVSLASRGGGGPKPTLDPLSTLGTLKPVTTSQKTGPEGIPIPAAAALAPPGTPAGQSFNGIECNAGEQLAYHIHAHLTIFDDGVARSIPAGIGIVPPREAQTTPAGPFVVGGQCFYWLHTHAADGIVHIESPTKKIYTLGDFFDIWGQPLGPNRVGPLRGHVTTLYDGKVFVGNPRTVPLEAHAQIQLELGKPLVQPVSISNWNGL
ncbi:MAG TPA: hypothetical protein VFA30_08290 [Gaiellaceae bacterium]|nr:hypothetical protein [Gaiellaceae bacterium]